MKRAWRSTGYILLSRIIQTENERILCDSKYMTFWERQNHGDSSDSMSTENPACECVWQLCSVSQPWERSRCPSVPERIMNFDVLIKWITTLSYFWWGLLFSSYFLTLEGQVEVCVLYKELLSCRPGDLHFILPAAEWMIVSLFIYQHMLSLCFYFY